MKKPKFHSKKLVSKMSEVMHTAFVNYSVTPKLLGIFEFYKKQCMRNCSSRLAACKVLSNEVKKGKVKKIFQYRK